MGLLTQEQVDSLVTELQPRIDSKDKRDDFGVCVYKEFFKSYPEYIQYFSKLQGLNKDNFCQSEAIKYYGGTLVDELVDMISHGANDAELQEALDKSGNNHKQRKISGEQFMSGEPIFIEFFNNVLTKPENKAAMEKFLKHVFPVIAGHL